MEFYTLNALLEMGADLEYVRAYSDLHKDVMGFRPRGHFFSSVDAFHTEYDRLCILLEEQLEHERVE